MGTRVRPVFGETEVLWSDGSDVWVSWRLWKWVVEAKLGVSSRHQTPLDRGTLSEWSVGGTTCDRTRAER